jgi:all-trans-8'-apo-beta-carotenal 15,15'-oxygenase
VATITLPHMLPLGLHGSWTGSYLGPEPGRAWEPTAYDIRNGVQMEP